MKGRSFIPKIFWSKDKKESRRGDLSLDPYVTKSPRPRNVNFTQLSSPEDKKSDTRSIRVFVATWNVGGKAPHNGLNLDSLLPADDRSDVYVLGFQEIVPLSAGNVLVIEDNEPSVKWLSLIAQTLNKPLVKQTTCHPETPLYYNSSSTSQAFRIDATLPQDPKIAESPLYFHKPPLEAFNRTSSTDQRRRSRACNCNSRLRRMNYTDSCIRTLQSLIDEAYSLEEDEQEEPCSFKATKTAATTHEGFSVVASKQMVGIFLTVWVRSELVQHVGHLGVSCVGRGIMGYFGNKGCIAVSLSLYRTSFCFICSHLASGEREGDELRRNLDVIEILKNTHFPRICKTPSSRNPGRILQHDQVIWLGDLNYRISLSYLETRRLVHETDWDALFEKDQLKIEREAGRVFRGWNEGKICFAPTYKYSNNSDAYWGDTTTLKKSKKKRTPAWCDRILWHGDGIAQLSYHRGESRFSDHRPVCAVFRLQVDIFKTELSTPNMRVGVEDVFPPSRNYFSSKNINDMLKRRRVTMYC